MSGRTDAQRIYERAIRKGTISRDRHWWMNPQLVGATIPMLRAGHVAREALRRGIVLTIDEAFSAVRSWIAQTIPAEEQARALAQAGSSLRWAKSTGAR